VRLYLDEDVADPLLAQVLRKAGHDVQTPDDVSMRGKKDPVQLAHAIREGRVFVARNYRDFESLHLLIKQAQGHHPGILVERFDKDPKHNLSFGDIVRALRNLEHAGMQLTDEYQILNHWQ
jgi:hypothetical protein